MARSSPILDHFAETAREAPAAAPVQVSDPQLEAPVGRAGAALGFPAIHTGRPFALVTKITAAKSLL
jgi:hypothetical protein